MASSLPPATVVLVVEDDPLLRLHAVEIIEGAGFKTVEAGNADDAIAILNARTDIRIVFTDVDMPGSMDGMKMAATIRDRWPPIELIITSGCFKAPAKDFPLRSRFFPKPYDEQTLIRAIRSFVAA